MPKCRQWLPHSRPILSKEMKLLSLSNTLCQSLGQATKKLCCQATLGSCLLPILHRQPCSTITQPFPLPLDSSPNNANPAHSPRSGAKTETAERGRNSELSNPRWTRTRATVFRSSRVYSLPRQVVCRPRDYCHTSNR